MLFGVLSFEFEIGAFAGACLMLFLWTVERIFRAGGWKGSTEKHLVGIEKQNTGLEKKFDDFAVEARENWNHIGDELSEIRRDNAAKSERIARLEEWRIAHERSHQ